MAAAKSRKPQSWTCNGKSRGHYQTTHTPSRTKLKYHKKCEKYLLQSEGKNEIIALNNEQVTSKDQIPAKNEHIAPSEAITIKNIPVFPPNDYVYQKGDWTVHAIVSSSAEKKDVKEALQTRDY